MVIKGSAAKHDGERLHPGADVEQGGKKEREEAEGRDWGVQGQGQEKKRKQQRERAKMKAREQSERER